MIGFAIGLVVFVIIAGFLVLLALHFDRKISAALARNKREKELGELNMEDMSGIQAFISRIPHIGEDRKMMLAKTIMDEILASKMPPSKNQASQNSP